MLEHRRVLLRTREASPLSTSRHHALPSNQGPSVYPASEQLRVQELGDLGVHGSWALPACHHHFEPIPAPHPTGAWTRAEPSASSVRAGRQQVLPTARTQLSTHLDRTPPFTRLLGATFRPNFTSAEDTFKPKTSLGGGGGGAAASAVAPAPTPAPPTPAASASASSPSPLVPTFLLLRFTLQSSCSHHMYSGINRRQGATMTPGQGQRHRGPALGTTQRPAAHFPALVQSPPHTWPGQPSPHLPGLQRGLEQRTGAHPRVHQSLSQRRVQGQRGRGGGTCSDRQRCAVISMATFSGKVLVGGRFPRKRAKSCGINHFTRQC